MEKTLKEEKLPAWLAVMEKLLAAQVTEMRISAIFSLDCDMCREASTSPVPD